MSNSLGLVIPKISATPTFGLFFTKNFLKTEQTILFLPLKGIKSWRDYLPFSKI